jgi:hypothetical protein
MLRNHLLVSLSALLLSVFVILLSTTPTATYSVWVHPRLSSSIEEVRSWMDASNSTEQKTEYGPCNVSPSLGYLLTQLKIMLSPWSANPPEVRLSAQPLRYSYYEKIVVEPYRSCLAEANAPSTSFCYLYKAVTECDDRGYCEPPWSDVAVCLPNSDRSSEGTCVSCLSDHLETALYNGSTLLKDEASIAYVKSTCDLTRPNPAPKRSPDEKNTTTEVRYLRWFLESSFVFERKKAGDECSANPELSKARSYLDILLKKHFGADAAGNFSLILTSPDMEEGKEEEAKCEAVRREMNDDEKHWKWWEEKLSGIEEGKDTFGEVYCSREEGLVCMEKKCRKCEDERVTNNTDLREACDPENEGHGKRKNGGGSPGKLRSEFAVILGILALTILGS